MTYPIDVLSAQKCSCLSWCVRARIVVVKSNLSSAVGFPDSLEDNWQTNGCIPLELIVLRCSNDTIATCPVFPKKQAFICLEVLRAWATFLDWLILKHPYSQLRFTFGLIRVNPQFITCHDVIDVFRSTAIVFLEHFFRPIDTSLFWAIDKLCVCAILNVCSSH